jgi:BlaI family transcriptional regulator, penicillinase repressor
MERKPSIAKSEWLVMKVLWNKSPLTYQEVAEELTGTTNWKPKTVQTLIRRLVAKGILDYEARGRSHHYSPAVAEEDCVEAEGQSFLARCFDGAVKPMLAHFVEKEDLSHEEIDELMRMLSEKKK